MENIKNLFIYNNNIWDNNTFKNIKSKILNNIKINILIKLKKKILIKMYWYIFYKSSSKKN